MFQKFHFSLEIYVHNRKSLQIYIHKNIIRVSALYTPMQIIRILQGGAQAYSVEELFLLAQPHSTWCHELKKWTIREEEVQQGTVMSSWFTSEENLLTIFTNI